MHHKVSKLRQLNRTAFLVFFILAAVSCLILESSNYAFSDAGSAQKTGKKYYSENHQFIILKISRNIKAYINKKNQKVYYYYNNNKTYYFWNRGIWFYSKKLKSMFKIAPQNDIPQVLRHGPILRVKRKKIPAGFAALKKSPKSVKNELPGAINRHLYNLPLTLHGLVIYQKKFSFNAVTK